jgi:hypothetical protein
LSKAFSSSAHRIPVYPLTADWSSETLSDLGMPLAAFRSGNPLERIVGI